MSLQNKPGTWTGMILKNKNTGCVYRVDYAIMSHVQLSSVVGSRRLFWDYRNVRKHFIETDNNQKI